VTEAEWLASANPTPMLSFLRRRASGRKLRLFACWCCRRNRAFVALPGAERVVAATERWAEGAGGTRAVTAALSELDLAPASPEFDRSLGAMRLGFCSEDAFIAATYTLAWATDDELATDERLSHQLRDIFGNPFRPIRLRPEWLTKDAISLAARMYEGRDFSEMPALADALQDAGCDSDEVLGHCRGPEPHVRGCWVVDLVLGEE
jgi:hypothetical protein